MISLDFLVCRIQELRMNNYFLNQSKNPVDIDNNDESVEFIQRLQHNRRLSDFIFYPLLVAYVLLIVFGVLTNILIICFVLRQRSNR